jgi:hypothetical protein
MRTRIFGTEGDLIRDEQTFTITNAISGKHEVWDASKDWEHDAGHGGADHRLVKEINI